MSNPRPCECEQPRSIHARIEVDTRPRCPAEGRWEGQRIPCDLHVGHKGKHEWSDYTGGQWKEWR